MSDVKVTVVISKELQQQVEAAAALRGETISEVVRSALTEYLKETKRQEDDPAWALQNDPVLSLRFTGGPGDVAERAKTILQDASDRKMGLQIDSDESTVMNRQ